MPISAGDRLGPYEILAQIGAGGMGEVYKARDTRLGRMVAIKLAHENFSERFDREARAIAALNHPNICQLYDVGPNYLVMELVDGNAPSGPLRLDEAQPVIEQLIEGIEAAHDRGIIHRDLKPSNVKLTTDGRVKILDFGLAKAADPETGNNPENSPTLSLAATKVGMILGTAAYMSPEQARGRTADRRSDIWSFGVMIYELLTGQRLFDGSDTSEVLAAVLKDEPDLKSVPAETRRLLRACLEKDPKKRLQAIGDARLLLLEEREGHQEPSARPALRIAWLLTAMSVGLAIWGWMRTGHSAETPTAPELALSIAPPAGINLSGVGGLNTDRISPDGSAVLFLGSDRNIHVRPLNSLETLVLPHLDFAGDSLWAPDSKSIALPTINGWMKLHLPDGAPEFITRDPLLGRGATWSQKGTILIAGTVSSEENTRLYALSANGGKPVRIEVPGLGQGRFYNPAFLPGGEDFLFAFAKADAEEPQIYLATLEGTRAANPTLLFANDTAAAYTSAGGGRVLFVRNDNLYAQKLDIKARKISGNPELVQTHVVSTPAFLNAAFSVSNSGTIVWRSGTSVLSQVIVFDRKGNRISNAGKPAPVNGIGLAPDEGHILGTSEVGGWVMESNGSGQSRIGSRIGRFALWYPDGSHLLTDDGNKLVSVSMNAGSQSKELADLPMSGLFVHVLDISSDGRKLLYGDLATGLFVFSLDEKRILEQPVRQQADNAAFSADGTWIVYHPYTEEGVYVQPLMSAPFRKQIAPSGNFPVWRKDSKEILYYDQGQIWSVRVEGSKGNLQFGSPEMLFAVARPLGLTSGSRPLAVNHDGSRIYFLQSTEQPESNLIQVRTRAVK
jgi:eukaryotic-like serine/threonine-protein kinase